MIGSGEIDSSAEDLGNELGFETPTDLEKKDEAENVPHTNISQVFSGRDYNQIEHIATVKRRINNYKRQKYRSNLRGPRTHLRVKPPCLRVCPTLDADSFDHESLGGPFGPEPYQPVRHLQMFGRNHMGNSRNPHGENMGMLLCFELLNVKIVQIVQLSSLSFL